LLRYAKSKGHKQRAGEQYMRSPPPALVVEQSAAHMESLVAMGFDRAAAEGLRSGEHDLLHSLSSPAPASTPPPSHASPPHQLRWWSHQQRT
ncbi:unnamed protein product, partial [Closterium sp. Yama58-4]